jgi:cation diffusion facilitator CzcD-associated flavoprotein CzcO
VTIKEPIIIGARPAGLACAAALRSRARSSTILEAEDRLAASWHRHYAFTCTPQKPIRLPPAIPRVCR